MPDIFSDWSARHPRLPHRMPGNLSMLSAVLAYLVEQDDTDLRALPLDMATLEAIAYLAHFLCDPALAASVCTWVRDKAIA